MKSCLLLFFVLTVPDESETEYQTAVDVQINLETSKKGSKNTENIEKMTEECPTCDCKCPSADFIPSLFTKENLKVKDRIITKGSTPNYAESLGSNYADSSWTARPVIPQHHNSNDQIIQRTFDERKYNTNLNIHNGLSNLHMNLF